MSRIQFLNSLKAELNYLPRKEAKDIIAGYNEYFETGLNEGKTEDELIKEFGEPATIANEILNDRQNIHKEKSFISKKLSNRRFNMNIINIITFLGIIISFALMGYEIPYENSEYQTHTVGLILVFIIPTVIILFGLLKKPNFEIRIKLNRKMKIELIIVSILIMILSGLIVLYIYKISTFQIQLSSTKDQVSLFNTISTLYKTIEVVLIISAAAILYISNENIYVYGLFFLLYGAFITGYEAFYICQRACGQSDFIKEVPPTINSFLIGIGLSIIILTLSFIKQKN